MAAIQSSNLIDVEYQPESSALVVLFKNGTTWRYTGVPQTKFDGLFKAESAGSYFYNEIRGHHASVQVPTFCLHCDGAIEKGEPFTFEVADGSVPSKRACHVQCPPKV
jgi:hypothetical protein